MEHHFSVTRTARYQQLGEISAGTRRVWLVCHGYGQLAAYFVRHFAFLMDVDPGTVVIAPEGLSRFYLAGNGGRVGASWMTRDDRLAEIADHTNFLNQLSQKVLADCPPDVHLTVLGFSQGTATVGRWLAQAAFRPAHLILWAGGFPHDVEPGAAQRLLHTLPLTLVFGTEDEYIDSKQAAGHVQHLQRLGARPRVVAYAGKHALNRAVLEQLAE